MNIKRDHTIDITRALAIALMVAANMAILASNEPNWIFRFISSLAAPIFITLTTMMGVLGFIKGKSWHSTITKSGFLFGLAASLDTVNGLLPFQNIDVLYLIALLMIIISFFGRFSYKILLFLIAAVLMISPILQAKVGYVADLNLTLDEVNFKTYLWNFFYELPHRYLIDGWFPLFPWLSLAFFGACLGKMRYAGGQLRSFAKPVYLIVSSLLIAFGSWLWLAFPGEQLVRYGYIELFYQPVPGFMLVAMGINLSLISLLDYWGKQRIFALIHPLGEASLFMYVFHILAIEYVLLPSLSMPFGLQYALIYVLLLTFMIIMGLALRNLRPSEWYKRSPLIVKWIFG